MATREKGAIEGLVLVLGYVGSVSAAMLLPQGTNFIGIDVNADKVRRSNRRMSPVVEPGMTYLI